MRRKGALGSSQPGGNPEEALDELRLSYRVPPVQHFHLPFPHHMHRLYPFNGSLGGVERAEALHRSPPLPYSAVAWSYDLLEEAERAVLRRLAVFVGGCTMEAAEAVCSPGGEDVLEALGSLVEKSLLRQREQKDGEPRFMMLEVVREFALEALGASGEAGAVRRLHAEFYAGLAEAAEPELRAGKSVRWVETIDQEHDNLRAAVEWGLVHQPEVALRIVGALSGFWFRRGYSSEGVRLTKQALERSGEEADAKLRAKACVGIGSLGWRQGDLGAAELFILEGSGFAAPYTSWESSNTSKEIRFRHRLWQKNVWRSPEN